MLQSCNMELDNIESRGKSPEKKKNFFELKAFYGILRLLDEVLTLKESKKQMAGFMSAKFKKMFYPCNSISRLWRH